MREFARTLRKPPCLPWRLGPLTPLDRVYQEQGFFPALAKGETETSPDVSPGSGARPSP